MLATKNFLETVRLSRLQNRYFGVATKVSGMMNMPLNLDRDLYFILRHSSQRVTIYYNERHQEQGSMDWASGCLKSLFPARAMHLENVEIESLEDFVNFADNLIKEVPVKFIPLLEILDEPYIVKETPGIVSQDN